MTVGVDDMHQDLNGHLGIDSFKNRGYRDVKSAGAKGRSFLKVMGSAEFAWEHTGDLYGHCLRRSFGNSYNDKNHTPTEKENQEVLQKALDLGASFIDTADV